MDPMMNGMTEMMMTFLLPAISEMIPPTKQPRIAVKAQHEAEMRVIFQMGYVSQYSYKTKRSLQM